MSLVHLILVRHAQAETLGDGAKTDADRALTKTGEVAAAQTGRLIASWNLPAPRIVTSPKLRALSTARIIASEMGLGEPEAIDTLRGDHDPDRILRALGELESGCLIVVGHLPDLGYIVARLVRPGVSGAVSIPTAGYVWLELDGIPAREPARVRMASRQE